ncbi:hypothetical protein KIN20_010758 [Parelaphostrongylus tenuis]|uniref:Uncharacterized protein n=1 Tax=Parelaphostrongylus tenuis TaxID=148309 RepID=A0AAD5MTZ2_PARTN|nr:hypothetical protein KIN20_010758 [Parelaphostrongylus tenuis]
MQAWEKNVHNPQGSEDDDEGADDAQRALLNVNIVVGDCTTNAQPPTVLPHDDSGAGVQHSIVTRCYIRHNVPHCFGPIRHDYVVNLKRTCMSKKKALKPGDFRKLSSVS